MKTTIVLFALIFGYITPTFSQLNRHLNIDPKVEPFQNKKNVDFGNYKFADKFNALSGEGFKLTESFNMYPVKPAPRIIYSGDDMPCFHPKGNYYIPCSKPTDVFFNMRVYRPESVIWGILF